MLVAQTATVTGRVLDGSDAVVPGVRVEVRSIESGLVSGTESNAEGFYNLPSLLPGRYDLSLSKQGFVTVRQTNLALAVQQVARLDVMLRLGELSQSVEVSAPYGPKTRPAAPQGHPVDAGLCETSELERASAPETPRIKQEAPKSWTRRRPSAYQPFITDAAWRGGYDFVGSGGVAVVIVQHASQALPALDGTRRSQMARLRADDPV
ncbi:MAG: carboxypeptidase regulatory-like domain-containing protein, partial [Acidobacteria bacterium]|nr:carboxypeptidase regulatory-like domain-containing protein [Acidobacteriota bacterium]